MTDSVDTDALRDLAQKTAEEIADVAAHHGGRIRMTIPANVDTDTDLLVDRLEEMALAAADEIDALRARAERAEALVAEVKSYADDRSVYAGTKNNTVGSWRIASDLHRILARASQPAPEVEQ